ncbi:MAG: cysteine hydrolase, partial [Alphaproteobacteria bacterium]|nr:cysteine hydrolase [Alphaproteobacteria bacterium]
MCDHQDDVIHEENTVGRRGLLKAGAMAATAVAATAVVGASSPAYAATDKYADPEKGALPPSDMVLD